MSEILSWLSSHLSILSWLGGIITTLAVATWTVFTYFTPKSASHSSGITNSVTGPVDQLTININQFGNPQSQPESEKLSSAIDERKKELDKAYSDARDEVRHWRLRWIESELKADSVGELLKIIHRISFEKRRTRLGPRILCCDTSILFDYIHFGRFRPHEDIARVFSFYLLSRTGNVEPIEILPSQSAEIRSLIESQLQPVGNAYELIAQVDQLRRLRHVFDNERRMRKWNGETELDHKLREQIFAWVMRYSPRRKQAAELSQRRLADNLSYVVQNNAMSYVDGRPFATYTVSRELILNFNEMRFWRTPEAHAETTRLAPAPVCHVYEPAWSSFIGDSLSGPEHDWLIEAADRLDDARKRLSKGKMSRGELDDLKDIIKDVVRVIDPFHEDVARAMEAERIDHLAEFRSWQEKLRDGQYIFEGVIESNISWLSKPRFPS